MSNIDENISLNSKSMYLNEIHNYPRLSIEDEKRYCEMLQNKEDKKLLVFNDVYNCVTPVLNIELLFGSLCNKALYKSIIDDLIQFHNGLNSNDTKVIDKLRKYQSEANKVNRALNISELKDIFNIDNVKEILLEKDLLKEIEAFMNYKIAFEKMFESNLGLVVKAAGKYYCNIDELELIGEGNIGLMRAITGFDASLGYKFSTYATTCIKQAIRRYISNYNAPIKIPEYIGNDLYKFKLKLSKLEQEEYRELTITEIAEKLNLSVEQVCDYLMYMDNDVSLDDNIFDEDGLTVIDRIPASDNVEDIVMTDFLKKDILDLLEVLNDRYQDIVKMKFSLGEYYGEKYTSREIAKKYSLSPQRIDGILAKSLYLMKRATKQKVKQKAIRDYYYN